MEQGVLLDWILRAKRDGDTNLFLGGKGITSLPPEIGQLTALTELDLQDNQLTSLPPEIGQLTALEIIDLEGNQLTTLPITLGHLTNIYSIGLDACLNSPPPEVLEQGCTAILAYLRERLDDGSSPQWTSKLLIVGQGGVGKTELLKALRGDPFQRDNVTTHGIQIRKLPLAHPMEPEVELDLRAWDFGGQEIYHATHQFFLTNRSLFLLVWNARGDFEQGKLYYWLDTIQALAPDSPVLLVATWTDERDADLPLTELQRTYPQIVGSYSVSNVTRAGIPELRAVIARHASGLPLMGEMWPTHWLRAAEVVRDRIEKHTTPRQFFQWLEEEGVEGVSARVLARWLHELGDILYFRDDEELGDLIILKPQWVTEYISKVLESPTVIESEGVFTRDHMAELWSDLDPAMREHFLRLMERFDLSYRTLENREISLVVERLPRDEPDYGVAWDAPRADDNCSEIAMKFELGTVPAGVPTWFIARTHRFTTHTHWRTGAVFADRPEPTDDAASTPRHLALVQAFPNERQLWLRVRGPYPQNFFALLKDGIEVTLDRFPGLPIRRRIPCPGHDGKPCTHEFDYLQLQKRVRVKDTIECPESLEDVSVTELLFGIHTSVQDAVLRRLDELDTAEDRRHAETLAELRELRELAQREFLNAYRREQSLIESECPNVFMLYVPNEAGGALRQLRRNLVGRQLKLQLFCQEPGCWHPTVEGGKYTIDDPAGWIKATAPYLRGLVTLLKSAAPLLGPGLGVAIPGEYLDECKHNIKLMEELVKQLPTLKDDPETAIAARMAESAEPGRAEGAALRAIRQLLDLKDPGHTWGELRKVLTPEGHYLWLCDEHSRQYLT